jgi:hypothetical protein
VEFDTLKNKAQMKTPCLISILIFVTLGDFLTPAETQNKSDFKIIDSFISVDVFVRQESGRVYFEFFDREALRVSKQKMPVEVFLVGIHFPGKIAFWEVVGKEVPKTTTPLVIYGSVPNGFVQAIPEQGSPPLLKKGLQYNVRAYGPAGFGNGSFVYEGP